MVTLNEHSKIETTEIILGSHKSNLADRICVNRQTSFPHSWILFSLQNSIRQSQNVAEPSGTNPKIPPHASAKHDIRFA